MKKMIFTLSALTMAILAKADAFTNDREVFWHYLFLSFLGFIGYLITRLLVRLVLVETKRERRKVVKMDEAELTDFRNEKRKENRNLIIAVIVVVVAVFIFMQYISNI